MRIRVRYSGRVQGVGFRATCRAIAGRAPVSGWVRNEDDGSVLLEVQGDASAVRRVLHEIAREMERFIRLADETTIADLPDERGFEIAR
ncbi:MAG TPA: acylphosphatase [Phycisphaerales bacterium]|nr:acylphosphatase [Phycisphaerales bacterium]